MPICLLLVIALCWTFLHAATAAGEEEEETQRVVVSGNGGDHDDALEEGGHGQPEWVDRSRVSGTTKLYVLNPFEMFAGVRSETDFLRGRGTTADLRQEFEIGLPWRLELDLENQISFAGRRAAETGPSLGARYAFADWNKIPLNPAVEASYQFGVGKPLADRFERGGERGKSDGYELRLLLGQELLPQLRWGANAFFEHDTAAAHERQVGVTQDIAYLIIPDRLEAGVEMRYANATRHAEGRGAANEFVIGPSVAGRHAPRRSSAWPPSLAARMTRREWSFSPRRLLSSAAAKARRDLRRTNPEGVASFQDSAHRETLCCLSGAWRVTYRAL